MSPKLDGTDKSSDSDPLTADQVGLNIMAKACYDPREAVRMWKRMEEHEGRLKHSAQVTEFLQTHPAHQRRVQNVKISILPIV